MANGIKTRPVRRMTQAELDGFLEKAADILRGNVDHSEFRGYVFALLFFRRISDLYQEEVAVLAKKLGDEELARDPKMHNFVVPEGCLWEEVARKNAAQLGTALNEAMLSIERANQPKFDGILTNQIDFNKQDELPRSKLVDLINHFSSQCFDRAHVPEDLFGNAYEYLIRAFASKAGKSSGEFYTPKEVAFLMSEIVEPKPGHHVCDWASGSAGLLLQCRCYVDKHHNHRANELFLYAWMQHVVKSLKPTGKAIIVMSQGILFRGQPEQTEAEDGRNQKADAEYVIREGFVKSDLMRILVPWRAFGDLAQCRKLIPEHETALVGEIEAEREAALKDIHDAYDPVLEPLPALKEELARLAGTDFDAWLAAPSEEDVYFGPLKPLADELQKLGFGVPPSGGSAKDTLKRGHQTLKEAKAEFRAKAKEIKDGIKERLAEVKRAVKELAKLDEERTERLAEVNAHADRYVAQVKEASADLARICADPKEAKRHFTVVERPEIEENKFNLNLPRFVDTFEPEEPIDLAKATEELDTVKDEADNSLAALKRLLKGVSAK